MTRSDWSLERRTLLGLALAAGASGALSGRSAFAQQPADPTPAPSLAPAPPAQAPPALSQAQVEAAVGGLDALVSDTMARTGTPGVAAAVVYDDKVLHLKGYGVRKTGQNGMVDADTRFQLASVSKPIASTVVAALVGDGVMKWDDPIAKYDPTFALADPWVSEHVTIADLFAHRSGLPDHAGDLLEDLGYDRAYVLDRLRQLPLAAFRVSYAYTNFGLTEGALAAAMAAGQGWEDLSRDRLYTPMGMTSTSSRFSDFAAAENAAATHVRDGNGWAATYVRQPDAQTPAGGVSSSIRDIATWLRLQLSGGLMGDRRLVAEESLLQTHLPQVMSSPPHSYAGRAGFYGLGWDVSYDEDGRLRLSHSGAFALGAATTIALLPGEGLAIAVLTNAAPIGAAETISLTFLDVAQHGHPTVDWVPLLDNIFTGLATAGRSPTDYSSPPSPSDSPRSDDAYTGTYANDFYGPLTVAASGSGMSMSLGPQQMTFPLTHYSGDTFSYQTTGENAVGLSGVTFTFGEGEPAQAARVENLDHDCLGTFRR